MTHFNSTEIARSATKHINVLFKLQMKREVDMEWLREPQKSGMTKAKCAWESLITKTSEPPIMNYYFKMLLHGTATLRGGITSRNYPQACASFLIAIVKRSKHSDLPPLTPPTKARGHIRMSTVAYASELYYQVPFQNIKVVLHISQKQPYLNKKWRKA